MKKKKEIDWDYIVSSTIMWIALAALVVGMSLAVYGCSATFIKGHDNTVNEAEEVDASGESLEMLGRRKNIPEKVDKAEYDEGAVIDTVDTVVKDTIAKDTIE